MYEVGTATTDITAFKPGIGMMGYGMHFNTVDGIETPLLARAFFIRDPEQDQRIVYVVCDMAFVTPSVRKTVLKRLRRKHADLGIDSDNLFLTAQHTHSGPGGYSHYGLYNISIPGFVPEVWKNIVDGITEAIVAASSRLRPARLTFHSGHFPNNIPVAFNRSMKSYLRNPEAKALRRDQSHLAVDREMKLLRIDGHDGEAIGAITWFGVHSTSVHNDNHKICWDNKGYAAEMLETHIRKEAHGSNFVGAFAQGAAGDVTPNYIWDKKKKWTRGPFENDFESAREIGRLQYEQAIAIYEAAPHAGHVLGGGLDSYLLRTNLAEVNCDPAFTDGQQGKETTRACHGVAFFTGTKEGPGMEQWIGNTAKGLAFFIKLYEFALFPFRSAEHKAAVRHKYKFQAPKSILFESAERRILGTRDIKNFIVPAFVDRNIRYLKRLHPNGWKEDKPWVPEVLPLQLLKIGDLVLAGIPGEITTVAAERLEKSLLEDFAGTDVHRVVLSPYSNAYCGYITTHQEYDVQAYEAGHTIYGKWTLAAFQTKFRQLVHLMQNRSAQQRTKQEAQGPEFTEADLQPRTYAENAF